MVYVGNEETSMLSQVVQSTIKRKRNGPVCRSTSTGLDF